MQHAGGEEDKDPGVYDGVDGDEDEGDQIRSVRLAFSDGVEVHPDLRDGYWGKRRRRDRLSGGKKRERERFVN